MEHEFDRQDLDAILHGDDEDGFERYLEKKVRQVCSSVPDVVEELPGDGKRPTSVPPNSSTSTDAHAAVDVLDPTQATITPQTRKALQEAARAALDADAKLQLERTRAALEAAEKRRAELQALPEEYRIAALEKQVEAEIEKLKTEPIPSTAIHVVEHETETRVKTHPVAGHYIEEVDGITEWDEQMRDLYFTDFTSHYNDDLSYEEVKANLQAVIQQTHKLTRGIKLIKAKVGGLDKAKAKLVMRLSELDRISMQELDQLERQKYHGRRVSKEVAAGKKASDSGTKAAKTSGKKGKTKAQQTIDTLLSLSFDHDAIVEKLKTQSLYDEMAQAYLNRRLAQQ